MSVSLSDSAIVFSIACALQAPNNSQFLGRAKALFSGHQEFDLMGIALATAMPHRWHRKQKIVIAKLTQPGGIRILLAKM
jgi:hypothetical protein